MRRRPKEDVGWPPQLATFDPSEWAEPDDLALSPVFRLVRCWSRWLDARGDYLRRAGYSFDKALELGFGELPAGLINEAARRGNAASKSPVGPPYSGDAGSQGRGAALHLPPQ